MHSLPTAIRVCDCKCSPPARAAPARPVSRRFSGVLLQPRISCERGSGESAPQPAPHAGRARRAMQHLPNFIYHLSSVRSSVWLQRPSSPLPLPLCPSPPLPSVPGHPQRRLRPRNLRLLKEEVEECQLSQSAPPSAPLCCLLPPSSFSFFPELAMLIVWAGKIRGSQRACASCAQAVQDHRVVR